MGIEKEMNQKNKSYRYESKYKMNLLKRVRPNVKLLCLGFFGR